MKPVLVACGVLREARIAERAGGVVAVAGGGDGEWLEARLEALAAGAAGVMSFGLCGALQAGLAVAHPVVADRVIGAGAVGCDEDWIIAIRRIIYRQYDVMPGRDFTVWADGTLVGTAARKAELTANGAVAVDMESHVAARVAARHGLPFAIVRVVSDTEADTLPPAFAVAMRRGGDTDVRAILRSLATHPGQLRAFVRASANAVRALRRLELLGRLLGPRLGLPDLR